MYEVGRATASVSEAGIATGVSVLETGDVHYPLVKQTFFHASFVICFYIQSQRRTDMVFSFFSHCSNQPHRKKVPHFFFYHFDGG